MTSNPDPNSKAFWSLLSEWEMGKTVLALLEAVATDPMLEREDDEGEWWSICPHCFEETPPHAEHEVHTENCSRWRASEVLREYRNSTRTDRLA